MLTTTRKILTSLATIVVACSACQPQQPAPFKVEEQKMSDGQQAPFNPAETYPSWAYDQPEYVKPIDELEPAPRAMAGDPLHYFTNNRLVMVRQPAGYNDEEIPRIAIWWTDDNGYHWHMGGFFGRSQSFFPLETQEDGDYGVRFVGPGQPPAEHTVAYPERMYHVDTAMPEVEVWVSPEQTWYNAGDLVTISWRATDPHLVEFPVRIGMLMDFTADEHRMIELQRDLADEGSFTYTLPADAVDHEIWFRVEALDRAENLGLAYSFALQVVDRPLAEDAMPDHPMQYPTGRAPSRETPTITLNEPTTNDIEPTLAVAADIVGDCERLNDNGPTSDEARVAIEQAAIEFDAFIATLARKIQSASEQGRALAAANTSPEVVTISATESSPADDDRLPSDEAVDLHPTQVVTITDAHADVPSAHEINDDAIDAKEPCDETAPTIPQFVDAQIGPMSLPAGELPYATAASRSPLDDPNAIIAAPLAGAFNDTPRAFEPRTTAVVAFGRSNRTQPTATSSDARTTPAETAMKTTPDQSTMPTSRIVDAPAPSIFTYQIDGWTFAGLSPSDFSQFDGLTLTAFDPTRGNGLLVPMPATVETKIEGLLATRPWQALGTDRIASVQPDTIWTLPRQTNNFAWRADHDGRFLADNPSMRNFAEPAYSPNYAGVPADAIIGAD